MFFTLNLIGSCILAASHGLPFNDVRGEDCPESCSQDSSGYVCSLSPNGDEQYFASFCELKKFNCRNGMMRYTFQNYGKCRGRPPATQLQFQPPGAKQDLPIQKPQSPSALPYKNQPQPTDKIKATQDGKGSYQRQFVSGTFTTNTDWFGSNPYNPYYNSYYNNRYPYGYDNNYYNYYNQPDLSSPWYNYIDNNPAITCNIPNRRVVILADSSYCNNQPYVNVRSKCAACIFMPNYIYRYLNDSNMNQNDHLVIISGTSSYPNNITSIVNDMVFLSALKMKTNVYLATIPIRPDQYNNPLYSGITTANMMIRDLSASTTRIGLMDLEDLYSNIVQYGVSGFRMSELCQWINDQVLKRPTRMMMMMMMMMMPLETSSSVAPPVVVPPGSSTVSTTVSTSTTASTTPSTTLSTTASTTASTSASTTPSTTMTTSSTTEMVITEPTTPAPPGPATAPTGGPSGPATGTAPTGGPSGPATGTAPTGGPSGPATGTGPTPAPPGPATGTGPTGEPSGPSTTGTGSGSGTGSGTGK